jgi:tRNA G18 (ribose-2'-O)-methylase SpoU
LAEAFMLERASFAKEPDEAEDFSGHRGGLKWQPFRWCDPTVALDERQETFKVALTLNENAVDFASVQYQFPLTLVIGEEQNGIPSDVVSKCDQSIAIPMFGLMGSLNVVTATGIVVQHIAREYARQSGILPIRKASRKLL